MGKRMMVFRSLEAPGTRLRLRLLLPKLLEGELGKEQMEGVWDDVGEVATLLEGSCEEDRWRGLWLKIVRKCRRTFEDDEVEWFRRLLEKGVCLMLVSSWRVSKRETNCATAMFFWCAENISRFTEFFFPLVREEFEKV